MTEHQRDWLFKRTEVGEVWGVGRRIGQQLKSQGINTVLDLKRLDPATVKRTWSVVLERTVRELNGIDCLDLEDAPPPKQEIACTRSFGKKVTDLQELNEAVSTFASRAAQKLRQQNSLANAVLVFIRTSPFREQDRQYSRSITMPLRLPSSDSIRIATAALEGLRYIYKPGFNYAKAGVMLLELQSSAILQQELDLGGDDIQREGRNTKLMAAMDAIQLRYGKESIQLGSAGTRIAHTSTSAWQMKQQRLTPGYTTDWNGLVTVS